MTAIDHIEAQLQLLSEKQNGTYWEPRPETSRSAGYGPSGNRAARSRHAGPVGTSHPPSPAGANRTDRYRSALDRIQAQLSRVDHALNNQGYGSSHQDQLDGAIREISDRASALNQQMSHSALSSHGRNEDPRNGWHGGDDSIELLRKDIANLRHLLEEANFSGASEQTLNEIAALSGRIDTLTNTISETRHDPDLQDTLRDIHALLDKPAQDPSIDRHFDRILHKLDSLPQANYQPDLERLSQQMENVQDMLNGTTRVQHLTQMSGQLNNLSDRLASLEASVSAYSEQNGGNDQAYELESRLSGLQSLVERLNPNDRLSRVEEQLASLADRLELGHQDVRNPIEILARQMEALTGLVDQRQQQNYDDVFADLTDRIANLDRRLQDSASLMGGNHSDQRFDHVEQTLARIDDMLARQMETTDFSRLENSISHLSQQIQDRGTGGPGVDASAFAQLEVQIAHLADKLDAASRNPSDSTSFEALAERLDMLTTQISENENRFVAVDRLGADIQRLTEQTQRLGQTPHSTEGGDREMAQQAALFALQQVGPLSSGTGDDRLDSIIDGLKDDLHGLRRLAETQDVSTRKSLDSVSSTLRTIGDRLASLETQVRSNEAAVATSAQAPMDAPAIAVEPTKDETKPARRGLGNLLRRKKGREDAEAEQAPDSRQLTAEELLANRGRTPRNEGNRQAASTGARSASAGPQSSNGTQPQASASQDGPRQPGIKLTGKAARPTKMAVQQATQQGTQHSTAPGLAGQVESSNNGQPPYQNNLALKAVPEVAKAKPAGARIVDTGSTPQIGPTSETISKTDFIAAARRAAQAAAQESQKVDQEEDGPEGFLARFKSNSKKEDPVAKASEQTSKGMSRKERRALKAEAKRQAKQAEALVNNAYPAEFTNEEMSAMSDMMDNQEIREGLLSRLRHSLSRHSRPLLMAIAAVLLAITTLQLAKNPNSSLHGMFSQSATTQNEDGTINLPAVTFNDANKGQSSLNGPVTVQTPASGQLGPRLAQPDAARKIAFGSPSGVERSLAAKPDNPMEKVTGIPQPGDVPASVISSASRQAAPQVGPTHSLAAHPAPTPGLQATVDKGMDLTPTSSVKPPVDGKALGKPAASQPMPAEVSPSIASAAQMNALLSPGISRSPLLVAAEGGDQLAQFEMGRRLTLGKGLSVDMTKAAEWFEKAADQGMPQAQYSLANLYEKGHGVKKDYQVARLWYERAANAGNIKAMHNLAVIHAEGKLGKPDFATASKWFVSAADHGLKDSQYNLAILHARGMGVKQDLVQSYKWFSIGAQNGDRAASSKRDEVFRVLTNAQQKTAKAIVAAWVPKVAKPSSNQLANLPDAWKLEPSAKAGETLKTTGKPTIAPTREVVHKTQSMLGALGFNAGQPDGQMGPRTRTAIRNFQESAGLPVTGRIDAALLQALSARVI